MVKSELDKLENNIISKLEFNKCRRLKRDALELVIANSFIYLKDRPSVNVVKVLTNLFEKYTLVGELDIEDIVTLKDYKLDYEVVRDVFEMVFRNMIAFNKLSDAALVRVNLNWEYEGELTYPYGSLEIGKFERNKTLAVKQIEDYLGKLERCEEESIMKYNLLKLLKVMRWKYE